MRHDTGVEDIERAEPGAELGLGPETTPRAAATVIVLCGGADALQVLLVQRNAKAPFMGGAWVFPGGAVEPAEGDGEEARRAAAIRELAEEAGIALPGPHVLVPFSRWITPPQVKTRFDTSFYLAPLPADAEPRVDGREVVDARWYPPGEALAAADQGRLFLVFPTIKHLEQLSKFESADALLAHARNAPIRPVQPRVLLDGEAARIVLPDEPGSAD